MKEALKKQLKKHPRIFVTLQNIRSALFHQNTLTPLQKSILENLKHKKDIFFVQVGSNDGIQGDPLHDLILKNKRWKGMFIEPVGFLFERLKENYQHSSRFFFEQYAISPNDDEVDFFYVPESAKDALGDDLPFWYDQLGSFDKQHIIKHLDGLLEPYIVSEKIKTVSLNSLFIKRQLNNIDLIHIDAEGYDYKVLSTIDFSKYAPSVILYENHHLSNEEKIAAHSLLEKNHYSCTEFDGDTLAVINSTY